MSLPRIEQEFGRGWLGVAFRIHADGDECEVTSGNTSVNFLLPDVSRVMVSKRTGFLVPKNTRTIHFLGPTGEVASLKTYAEPTHVQATATFVRYLIQEWKRSERAAGKGR
jgi:hypothetical protein